MELLIAISLKSGATPAGITARLLSAARYAMISGTAPVVHVTELTATLDALFDWFDRSGRRAVGGPFGCGARR